MNHLNLSCSQFFVSSFSAHGLLLVQYGPGTRENERVMVMNSKGGSSAEDVRISYEQCALGMRQQSEVEQQTQRNNEGYLCGTDNTFLFVLIGLHGLCVFQCHVRPGRFPPH